MKNLRCSRTLLALRTAVVVFGFLLAVAGDVLSAQTTPAQNLTAFRAAATLTNRSYHWDSLASGQPQVATTTRLPLPATTLTTVSWDPLQPELFQEKVIDSATVQCTLVATFTGAYDTWTAPAGTVTELTYSEGGTTNYIMPFVTWGGDLRDYLRTAYFTDGSIAEPALVQTRIQQSLGLAPTTTTNHGLAFFWVPLANLARPAYSADIAAQLPSQLPTFSDGSYQPVDASGPTGFSYLDVSDASVRYSTLSDYVEWNQAQTSYPWTAMGYTFNWNSLQDGSDPSYGTDPLAPTDRATMGCCDPNQQAPLARHLADCLGHANGPSEPSTRSGAPRSGRAGSPARRGSSRRRCRPRRQTRSRLPQPAARSPPASRCRCSRR